MYGNVEYKVGTRSQWFSMESKKTYSQETIHLLKIVYFSGEKKEKKGKKRMIFVMEY